MRGYWSVPKDVPKESIPDWFRKKTQKIGLSELKDVMYLQQSAGSSLVSLVSYCCIWLCYKLHEKVVKGLELIVHLS